MSKTDLIITLFLSNSLLARGASDTQVARFLHRLERDQLGHPELANVELTPLLSTLRTIERTAI